MIEEVGRSFQDLSGFDFYVFIVCFVSFVATFGVLSVLLFFIIKSELKSIKFGVLDEQLVREHMDGLDKRFGVGAIIYIVFSVLTIGAVIFLGWTFVVRFRDPKIEGPGSVPRVVLSDSMSEKHENNKYLEENGLDDQFDTFDLIFTEELPDEFELQLYDIVVYKYDDESYIIHRIVGIEEPNEKHPDHRLFYLRGDAIRYSDNKPVEYSQMMSIYRGERIQYVGSFIHFMQSPAGYLCILLMVVGFILTPVIDILIKIAKKKRLIILGYYL